MADPPRRVVVLGGTGFIGRHLAREFASAGAEVASFGRQQLDLCDPASAALLAERVGSGDILFFASVIPPQGGRDRESMLRNVQMGDTVCRFLERSPCAHLVYLSTDNVFSPDEETLHEGSRLDPCDLYGLGHLVRERLLEQAAAAARVPYLVLRTGPVYGPEKRHDSYGPDRFLRTARQDGVVTLFGEGEEIRHHLLVLDLARAVRQLVAAGATGAVHVAPPDGTSFKDLALLVQHLLGGQVRIQSRPREVPLRHRLHLGRRLPALLPQFQFTPLAAGLEQTLAAMPGEV